LLCSVNLLPEEDISLLFKTLVVLPQDKPAKNTVSKLEKENRPNQTPVTSEDSKPTEIAKSDSPTEETKTLEDSTTPENLVEEPKTKYNTKTPFVILLPTNLKEAYLQPESPFIKILAALKISGAQANIATDTSVLQKADNYLCIWCIGLDIQQEKTALGLSHPNLLTSPDILSLKSNEEKKAMYAPLKAFINSNMETISQ